MIHTAMAVIAAVIAATCAAAPLMPAPVPVLVQQVPSYDRDAFGQAWSDDVDVRLGHNGCDTRNDVLREQARDVQLKHGTNGCVVASGTLDDPYTDAVIRFRRGDGQVEMDHVVALAWAWRHGAWAWTDDQRRNFANDPANLRATSSDENQGKGDAGPAEWLPSSSDPAESCAYARTWGDVVAAYGLQPGDADRQAQEGVLARC